MTIQKLIEDLEELDDLDGVYIHEDGKLMVYEGDDIEFIHEDVLDLVVKHHKVNASYVAKHKHYTVEIWT